MPTVRCLVHLTHTPFFVTTLDEIEVAFFERLAPSIKNFDLVFIFKDYTRFTLINAIPNQFKDHLRQWLDSCNILFFESAINTKWDAMLKRIRSDFEAFVYEDEGWKAFSDEVEEDGSDGEGEGEKHADSDFDSNDFDEEDEESDDSGFSEDEDAEEAVEEGKNIFSNLLDSLEESEEFDEDDDEEDSRPKKKVKR